MQIKTRIIFLIIIFGGVFGLAKNSEAAEFYVRPTTANDAVHGCANSGNGSSWECASSPGGAGALSGFPAATTLIRGNTYYLSSGIYGNIAIKQDQVGTLWIYIKKATSDSHGVVEAGWDTALGTDPADFTRIGIEALDHGHAGGYIEIDGVIGSAPAGGYGIRVHTDGVNGANLVSIPGFYFDTGSSHITLKNMELYHDNYTTDASADGLYCTGNCNDFLLQNLYIHDIPRNNILLQPFNNVVIDGSTIKRNHSTTLTHGQGLQLFGNNSSGMTIKNSWFEDITGTAVINSAYTQSNFDIYNNVFISMNGSGAGKGPFGTNDSESTLDGLRFYGNTIVNYPKGSGVYAYVYLYGGGTYTNINIKNNLWFCNLPLGSCGNAGPNQSGVGIVSSNNWYSSGITYTPGTNDYGNSTNPFINMSGDDFRLISGSDPIGRGLDLGTPYDSDRQGVARSVGAWDIGAYEYVSGDTTPPDAPSGLSVS